MAQRVWLMAEWEEERSEIMEGSIGCRVRGGLGERNKKRSMGLGVSQSKMGNRVLSVTLSCVLLFLFHGMYQILRTLYALNLSPSTYLLFVVPPFGWEMKPEG